MDVTKTIIQEARITDMKNKTLIDIILRMKSDFENCEVYIESPHKELLSVKLSNFSEHISFERFINIIKDYVEKSSDLNEVFISIINFLSTSKYCTRIKINCNNLIDKINLKDIIKNYKLFDILFTALFDRGSGELLKVTQPNASEPKLVIEFKKDINVVKQLIFSE